MSVDDILIRVVFVASLVWMVTRAIKWAEAGAAYNYCVPSTWVEWDDAMLTFLVSFFIFLLAALAVFKL